MKKQLLPVLLMLVISLPNIFSDQTNTPIIKSTATTEDLSGSEVLIIPIHGEINRALTVFVRRGLKEAEERNAEWVIFDIDTFGGLVESALQIATLIGSREDINTAAWIPANPETTGVSWSAGALISLACDSIYMAPGTSIGSAAPVYSGAQGMEAAPEKTVSAVRTQMAALAEKNGYPKAVAAAMVDMDIELIEIDLNGETMLVSSEDIPMLEKRAEREELDFEQVRVVSKSGKLLALTAGEMEYYGLSSGTVSSIDALLSDLELADITPETYVESTSDRIISIITGSVITSLLMMVGLGALYLEITSPGFGVPGTVAIIAFTVIFAGNFLLGTAGSMEIILFILGAALLAVEIFLIPGFGATGISGILLIAGALVISRQDFIIPEFQWQKDVLENNLLTVGSGLLGSIIITAFFFRFFHRIPGLKKMILEEAQNYSEGFHAQTGDVPEDLLGKTGISATPLRPAGKGEFGNSMLMVESEGDYIESGRKIVITGVNGNRIRVREE